MSASSSPRFLRLGIAWSLAVSLVTSASAVFAKPEFPGIVQTTLKLACAPPCLICHTTPVPTDSLTAIQPFVNNVIATGPITEDQIGNTILLLESAMVCPNEDDASCTGGMCTGPCDADVDGMPDVEELRKGRNPNNSSELPCVEYGCGSRIAPERGNRPLDGAAALLALGTAFVLLRRFRR